MRKIFLLCAPAFMMLTKCNYITTETIHGNGHLSTSKRNVTHADKIKSMGNFDVDISLGVPSVNVEADENLLPYIITENKGDWLEIRTRKSVNLSSPNKIKVKVTTDKLESIDLAGNGNVTGNGKFTGSDNLHASIAGTGNISLVVNTPRIDARIAGSGNITLAGETKNTKIEIGGVGDFKAGELMSENVEVQIYGSGNVHVYAEKNLDIVIAGNGDVLYKGNAKVTQHVAGSGTVKHE